MRVSFSALTLHCVIASALAGYDFNGEVFSNDDLFGEDFDGNYRFKQCGGLKSMISVKQLKATPGQFVIPQIISLSTRFKILKDILPPLTIKIKISKKIPFLGYIKLPCIAKYGSCTYKNACEILERYPKDSFEFNMVCPSWFKATNIGCKCPFKAGSYKAEDVPVSIETKLVPKWIATGDYKTNLMIEDRNQTVGCFNFQFRLM